MNDWTDAYELILANKIDTQELLAKILWEIHQYWCDDEITDKCVVDIITEYFEDAGINF